MPELGYFILEQQSRVFFRPSTTVSLFFFDEKVLTSMSVKPHTKNTDARTLFTDILVQLAKIVPPEQSSTHTTLVRWASDTPQSSREELIVLWKRLLKMCAAQQKNPYVAEWQADFTRIIAENIVYCLEN